MKKQNGNNLMQKWKNKAGVRLSALDKKKLVLTMMSNYAKIGRASFDIA